MTDGSYKAPPKQIDMAAQDRAIRRAGGLAFAAFALAAALGHLVLPGFVDFAMETADRLAFAAVTSVPLALCVVVAVAMVSTGRRRSPEDIGGSAAGPPSERIAVRTAFLQNTHEQAFIAVVMYFAYCAVFTGAWLSLLPVGAAFFVVGRILFLRGYTRGAQGRALGMALTMLPTAAGYLLVVGMLVKRLLT